MSVASPNSESKVERKFSSGEVDVVTDGTVVLCMVEKAVGSFDATKVAVADDIVAIAKFFCRRWKHAK